MATLYVVSVEGGVGKTAVALGIALSARRKGLKVGYMKPVSAHLKTLKGRIVDSDVVLAKEVLDIEAPFEKICPFLLTGALRTNVMWGEPIDAATQVKDAFDELSRDTDLMVVESPASLHQGITLGLGADKVVDLLDAKAIAVVRGEFHDSAEAAVLAQNVLGERVVGVVINSVPTEQMPQMRTLIGPYLKSRNLELFGILPRNYLPGAFTVDELASILGGQIVANTGKGDVIVESFAMAVANAETLPGHPPHRADRAVIVRADSADMIYAALDMPTRCIILCGHPTPDQTAISRAFQRQVPLLQTALEISEVARRIDEASAPVIANSERHINRLSDLIDRELSMNRLLDVVGVSDHTASNIYPVR